MANLVNEGGGGLFAAATTVVGTALVADVNAAVAATPGLRLVGYSAQESAGVPAAASFRIMKGATVAGGTAVAYQKFAASGSNAVHFGDAGIDCASGISIDWVSGQVDVTLFVKVV